MDMNLEVRCATTERLEGEKVNEDIILLVITESMALLGALLPSQAANRRSL